MSTSAAIVENAVFARERAAVRSVPRERAILLAYAVLCCASLVPFIAIAQPPIVDFANHAARLTLACSRSDPVIAAMFQYRLGLIPNLAVDVVNLPLCGILSPSAVLRLVTGASLALIYLSAALLQRKLFGRVNGFLFVLPAIAFNLVTTMGYMNFLAGVALSCFVTAIALGRQHSPARLILLCNAFGVAIFFSHIFALAFALLIFFGLNLGTGRLSLGRCARAACWTGLQFALPLALVLLAPRSDSHFAIGFFHKVRTLPALFMTQHVGVGVFGLILLAPLYLLLRNKLVAIAPAMRWSLVAGGLFVLLSPSSLQNAVDVDSRMLVALGYVFFACLVPTRREREIAIATGSIAAALVALELWSATTVWLPFSKQIDELRRAGSVLPAQAKVLTVASSGPELKANLIAYSHATSYLTIQRRIYNPLEFTGVGMQPLSVTAAYVAVDSPTGQPYSPELANQLIAPDPALAKLARDNEAGFAVGWPRKFDYVIFYHFGRPSNFNPALLSEVAEGSFFTIYKVRKATART